MEDGDGKRGFRAGFGCFWGVSCRVGEAGEAGESLGAGMGRIDLMGFARFGGVFFAENEENRGLGNSIIRATNKICSGRQRPGTHPPAVKMVLTGAFTIVQ
jgi:hypothetical protein